MNHDEIRELIGAYALDAVDPDEAELVAEHLKECARCRAEVAELREVAAHLSHTGAAAPAGVWRKIAGSLGETPPPLRLHVERRRGIPRPVALGAIAAAVVAIVVLGAGVLRLRGDLRDVQRTVDSSQIAAQATRTMNAPGARIARLTGAAGDTVTAVVSADGQGFLLAQSLPPVPGHIYQLWGATASGVVTSLGTMAGPGTYAFAADPSIRVVMVTVETAPAPAPTSAAIATGTLT